MHTIWDLCEGWPQGIVLAIQTLATCIQRGAEFKFTGLSSSVRRYFSSNVSGSVSPELIGVYKVLSVFERFNESLFQVVFEDQEAARDSFREIVTNGDVLVVSCDDEDEWYRFNPLFADWIRRNLQPSDKHGIRRACLAASEWFNGKGYTEEAAKYVLMYVDFKYVSNVVESTSGLKCGIGDTDAFVWINQIPSSRFSKSPLMSLLSAWAYNAVGHVKDAEEWLEFFKGAAASSPKISEEDTAIAVKLLEAKHMAMAGDGQLALKMNEELLLSVRSTEHSLSSLLYQSIGEANARLGRLRVAEEMFLQAQASASVDNTEHHLYFNMFSYAKVRFDLGDFDECEATCRKLIEACPRELVFYNGGFALLALIHIERDLVDEASSDIRGALEGATPYRNVNMYLLSKVAESTLLAAKGNLTGAYEVISESVIYGERTIVPLNYLLTAYFKQSELAAKRGSERDLQVIERKFKLRDAHDNNHRTMFQMVEGKRLQQQGDLEAAAIAYSAAVESAKNAGAAFLEAKAISFLLACGDKGSAPHKAALLTRLIHLADSRGFVRVLLNAGAPMRDILRKYSSSSHANAHTRQFVKSILVKFEQEMHSFQNIQDMQNASIEKLEYLTSREREVLALLNMGMSRKEIADTLSVSLNTGKKHLSNIYAKLGVRNRNQALDSISAVAAPETSKEIE